MINDLNMPSKAPPDRSTDPARRLGTSLFLSILAHCDFPTILTVELVSRRWRSVVTGHEKSIWKRACHDVGVEYKHMTTLEAFESAASVWHGDPEEPEPMPPDEPGGSVQWRGVCKSQVQLDRNWKWGRCRESWITPLQNAVWRFKLDPEQQTALASSRTGGCHCDAALNVGGLVVEDTSQEHLGTLYLHRDVRPMAHVELAKGFVVFDVGEGEHRSIARYSLIAQTTLCFKSIALNPPSTALLVLHLLQHSGPTSLPVQLAGRDSTERIGLGPYLAVICSTTAPFPLR